MTQPYDPTTALLTYGLHPPSTTKTLPNGQYDIYDLGVLWDKTLYLGNKRGTSDPVDTSTAAGVAAASHPPLTPVVSTPYDYIKEFAGWSVTNPDQFAALQKQLYDAGFYEGKKPRLGVWTPGDGKAMKTAITGYLGVVNPDSPQPLTLSDYLDHASTQGKQSQPTPAIPVTDPDQIRQAAQAAFQAATGKGASNAQLDKFVAQFQSAQTSAQTQMGGTAASPDLSAEAMAYAQQTNPAGYQAHQRSSYVDTLVNMFAPSGSQRPNMTPIAGVGG